MTRPPRLRRLLAALLPATAREDLLAELDREFRLIHQERGSRDADAWYRRQVVASVWPALSMRRARTMIHFEQLWRDVRYAMRTLWHAKLFTMTAALALALGIGGAATTFAVADAFLFRQLPFGHPDELVHVWAADPRRGRSELRVSLQEFEAWTAADAVAAAALFNYTSEELTVGPDPERLPAGRVSANVFEVLGATPVLGRGFVAGEDRPGADPVVVISHRFWQTRFGGRPTVLSETVDIGGARRRIVGVMPAAFVFPLPITEFWLPYVLDQTRYPPSVQPFQVVARLKPGTNAAQAAASLTAASASVARHSPALEGRTARVADLRRSLNFAYDIFSIGALVVGLANLLVLLTAAANVSSLVVSRSLGRRREFAIRTAVGASRLRLLQQLVAESLVLGLFAGVLGAVVAAGATRALNAVIPDELFRVGTFAVDFRTILVLFALSMFASLVIGLMPALRASRIDLAGAMRQDGGAATTTRAGLRLQASMVVKQVALTIVLLVVTLLVTRSFSRLSQVPTGFVSDGVLSVQTILARSRYDGADRMTAFQDAAVERVGRAVGGAVAFVDYLPLNHEADEAEYETSGNALDDDGRHPSAWTYRVSPAYFDVLRVPLRAGREFTGDDRAGRRPVAIINETMARRHWPNGDSIGQSIRVEGYDDPLAIVGVVGDTRQFDLAETGRAQIFVPLAQRQSNSFRMLVRVDDPARAAVAVVAAIHDVDRILPVTEVQPLRDVVDAFLLPQRSLRSALIVSGTFALSLAVFGIYGIVACFVNERTRELAIRSALGARPREIIRLVTARSLRLVLRGAAIGVPLAMAVSYAMRGLLFGVSVADPLTYLAVAGLVSAVALAAAFLPAWRAGLIDPAATIRLP